MSVKSRIARTRVASFGDTAWSLNAGCFAAIPESMMAQVTFWQEMSKSRLAASALIVQTPGSATGKLGLAIAKNATNQVQWRLHAGSVDFAACLEAVLSFGSRRQGKMSCANVSTAVRAMTSSLPSSQAW